MPNCFMADIVSETMNASTVLSPYIYVFYVAFIISFIFTPIMRAVAIYYGIIDQPDGVRKMHQSPVAYLGGVAVFLGWIGGMAVSQFVHLHRQTAGGPSHPVIKFSIIAGACIVVLIGLWDDRKGIRPWMKIVGQVIAALFLLCDGIGTRCTAALLDPVDARLHMWFTQLGWISQPGPLIPEWFIFITSSVLVIFVVVGCCNATNLMDGLDGLCSGVTAIIVMGFLFIATHLAIQNGILSAHWDGLRIVLALALLGGVLGFVPFNFNPASIFMGDTGSLFLGFVCAVMIILMGQNEHPRWFLASMIMFALPVLDTMLAFARRWLNGRPIFSADRFHFHHQMIARGFTVKQTVLISYSLAISFALLGAAIVFMRTRFAVAFYLVIFGSIFVAAYKMGMVHEKTVVNKPRQLGSETPVSPSTIESASVLEIRDEDLNRSGKSLSADTASVAWTRKPG